MASTIKDTEEPLTSLRDAAEAAGKKLMTKLENKVTSAEPERKYLLFEPKDYNDVLDIVIKRFAQVVDNDDVHGNRLTHVVGVHYTASCRSIELG